MSITLGQSASTSSIPAFLRPSNASSPAEKEQQSTTSDQASLQPSPSSSVKLLVPPLNFQNVAPGISRSGHPNERNYSFLRTMKLKTIMYIANEDYRSGMSTFAQQEGIQVLHHPISVNKEPFGEMETDLVAQALTQVLDKRNHPILIHCNKGKYRIGCFIGILRRLQGWSHTSIFEEHARFAGSKAVDEEFIESFELERIEMEQEFKPDWL